MTRFRLNHNNICLMVVNFVVKSWNVSMNSWGGICRVLHIRLFPVLRVQLRLSEGAQERVVSYERSEN